MTTLDPLRIPLHGLSLIEASAGTGKTYSIATLYLRLLLEPGLEVDRILVVTFTEAATQELRDRIRKRLVQALDQLRSKTPAPEQNTDPILVQLLSGLPDREQARIRLTDTLTRLDEAAIHTIHGFCLRTLTDHAFESGAAFDAEFITDETRLRTAAVEDYWRRQVAGADLETARRLREYWRTPQDLLADLEPTLTLQQPRLLPRTDPADIRAMQQELARTFTALQAQWHEACDQVKAILTDSPALNRRSYNKKIVAQAIRIAADLAAATEPPASLPAGIERLTPAGLAKGAKPNQTPPEHPFFDLCGRTADLTTRTRDGARAWFLASARAYVLTELERRKRDAGLLYYDDLLHRLDQALAGDGAKTLAATVRDRYPAALIDEFQDTDPQQYRIFRRIYGGRSDCGLFLIGDPKQAIYAFRGADIFTYMQARDDSRREGNRYGLTVNRRSGSRLIQAINHLFTSAREPFIYADYIGFDPVQPGPEADAKPLRIRGVEPVPLQFRMLRLDAGNQTRNRPGFIRSQAALESAARACAEAIAGLLNQADAGQATIGNDPLQPGDIAVLVRTHREGDLAQQALRAQGVNSVTLSQDSVFATAEAEELAILLSALAELHDAGRVRTALATGLLGRNAADLVRLADDELAWEALLARFQSYRESWRRQGIMVTLQRLLAAEQVPARLLRRPDGERRLTNLLQLMELLQLASGEHPGLEGLVRRLADQRAELPQGEAQQLRLESDERLVKVVTLHKSKGLEYPLVFIPFPWSYSKQTKKGAPVFFHAPEDKRPCLDLGSPDLDRHRRLQQTEQLAERLRLFYVGVTRAAKLCVLYWGKINGAQDSALAYLLHPDRDAATPAARMAHLSEEEIRATPDALAAQAPDAIQVQELSPPTGESWGDDQADATRLRARAFRATIDASWQVTSYSGLTAGDESERPDFDTPSPLSEAAPEDARIDPLFVFPAGTHVGRFLHRLFEVLDFPHAGGEALTRTVRGLLDRYGGLGAGRAPDRDWAPRIEELVANVLDTWLDPGESLRLRDIAAGDRITELEFHFPVAGLDLASLSAALAGSEAYADCADGLEFEPMRGLMHGFVDLVFRYGGRYYIADYKSNRLGYRLAAYQGSGLDRAVRHHRYRLQYLIYTLALHRFLAQRLPDYDYRTHCGGVYYLFLRGMHPRLGPDCGVWYDQPPYRLIRSLDRLFAGGP